MTWTAVALSLLLIVSLVLWFAARRMVAEANKQIANAYKVLDEAERLVRFAQGTAKATPGERA